MVVDFGGIFGVGMDFRHMENPVLCRSGKWRQRERRQIQGELNGSLQSKIIRGMYLPAAGYYLHLSVTDIDIRKDS